METFTNSRREHVYKQYCNTANYTYDRAQSILLCESVQYRTESGSSDCSFQKMGAEEREIITDKASGKDIDRPGYQALKTTLLRPGDTLVIVSLDRLSRKKGRH